MVKGTHNQLSGSEHNKLSPRYLDVNAAEKSKNTQCSEHSSKMGFLVTKQFKIVQDYIKKLSGHSECKRDQPILGDWHGRIECPSQKMVGGGNWPF